MTALPTVFRVATGNRVTKERKNFILLKCEKFLLHIVCGHAPNGAIMQINLTIDNDQLIDAAAKMPLADKLKLYDKIKDDILRYRLEALLAECKTDGVTEEEITEIVEHVRSERYQNRH